MIAKTLRASVCVAAALALPAFAQNDGPMPKAGKAAGKAAPQPIDLIDVGSRPPELQDLWTDLEFQLDIAGDRAGELAEKLLNLPSATPEALAEHYFKSGSALPLRLAASPELGAAATKLAAKIAAASRARLRDPQRLAKYIGNLAKSESERVVALAELRRSGEWAVPAFAEALPNVADPAALANDWGALPQRCWQPTAALLDGDDPKLRLAALQALAGFRAPASAEELWRPAADPAVPAPERAAAAAALQALGLAPPGSPRQASNALVAVANSYRHARGARMLGAGTTPVWTLPAGKLAETELPNAEAERGWGLRAARAAVALAPDSTPARIVLTQLSLMGAKPEPDPAARADADVLAAVLAEACAERRADVALAAANLLGGGRANTPAAQAALQTAFDFPSPRVPQAAAAALLAAKPLGNYARQGRIVPLLTRALVLDDRPVALVLDGDAARAGNTAAALRMNGYLPRVHPTGRAGFADAAASGNVEILAIDPLIQQHDLAGLLADLAADARTASARVAVFAHRPAELRTEEVSVPTTSVEKDNARRKHDKQIFLNEFRSEMWPRITQVDERTGKLVNQKERMAWLLRRVGFLDDPEQVAKVLAPPPETVVVKPAGPVDQLDAEARIALAAARTRQLDELARRYPNVRIVPRNRAPQALARNLAAAFGDAPEAPLSTAERAGQQTQALALLGAIADGKHPGLDARLATPALVAMLQTARHGPAAAAILAKLPGSTVRTELATATLNPVKPLALRVAAATALAASAARERLPFEPRVALGLRRLAVEATGTELQAPLDQLMALMGPRYVAWVATGRGTLPKGFNASIPAAPSGSTSEPEPNNPAPAPKKKKAASDDDL